MFPHFRLLRPHQWVKNFLVWAALFFSWDLSTVNLQRAVVAFAAFCLAASTIYILNDITDAPADRLHPEKKYRPIASNQVSLPAAYLMAFFCLLSTFVVGRLLPPLFLTLLFVYLFLNLAYSYWLKKLFILDVMVIASGFVLRVLAGGAAIAIALSPWIILCTFFLSLFLGFGKRKNEVDVLRQDSRHHRKVLLHYTPDFIDQLLGITAGMTIIAYALYTIDERTVRHFDTAYLVYTLPFVVYGIFRYFHLMYNHNRGGDPTRILARDWPTVLSVLLWLLTFLLIVRYT
jgi:4-hydroxybenzoate polyprenyltransferase